MSKKENANKLNSKGNLIPLDERKVLSTILTNQQKFNIVFEKVIDALDKLTPQIMIQEAKK